ncbi:hypothetical protein N9230_02960 [Akkermansiaceae bacterium]|nr:hypothetical protein [Akkermansiaceae bacterium]
MFEDFGSSGRGPGLVGILLALLILAGFGGMAVAVYWDEGGSENTSIEAKISENNSDIRIKKESLVGMEERLAVYKDYQQLSTEVTLLERRIKEVTADQEDLEKQKASSLGDIEAQNTAFIEYRQQYRFAERAGAEGETLDLSTTHGPDFKEVEILGITATHLKARTKSGIKGIAFQELPLPIQDRFQFSEDEAKEFQIQLAAANKIKDARIAEFQKAQDAKAMDRKAQQRVARMKEIQDTLEQLADIAKKKRQLSADFASQARRHLADDRDGRRTGKQGMHKSLARQDQEKANRYSREADAADKEADKLHQELTNLINQE